MRSEDRYNPQHIESLPPEIREAVIHLCATPRAMHTFAGYIETPQKVVLHFEHFYCEAGDARRSFVSSQILTTMRLRILLRC